MQIPPYEVVTNNKNTEKRIKSIKIKNQEKQAMKFEHCTVLRYYLYLWLEIAGDEIVPTFWSNEVSVATS